MAQHDFAPAWLNFPTPPSSTKSSLNLEKHYENFSWTENRYEANCRRHSSSDGFDPNIGRSNGGHFGRRERNGWRVQGRNGSENTNHRGGYHGGGSRARTRTFHCGKGQGWHEDNVPDTETGKKEDKVVPKQFEAEDFPSLNPEYEREPNQNKSLAAGVWEYPLNPKSRSPRMLVIKKGNTKELQISGFPVVGSLHSQSVRDGTGTSIYKGLVPKPVTPPAKPTQWKSQAKENKLGNLFPHESASGVGSFSPFTSIAKAFTVSQNSVKEDDESFNSCNSNSPHHERDINQNFESEILQENGNASITSQQIIQSSTFPQADVLSSSLEAEHRLLKEMGWQEDTENDETFAPLTEDEMREFRIISEQLQKNGLRKNIILKNDLICDFKFSPWKNSTFTSALENEDSETSSSDTSDDDDV
ncbi:vasculin isoform X2 [Falco rusticolus]|uniref:vasculin isoform X2 n=1 Tax=Falco rusticolus TaxID=120794 RepID=UPI0006B7FCE7|nr:vasculin isoform X2 [Falco rusticolus]